MKPRSDLVTLRNNASLLKEILLDLVLRPRRDLAKWARITKQTPNIKIGYPAQHLASLITGMEGERTAARGNDLRDGSEVKSCSRLDQLDKCRACSAAVARIEDTFPACTSREIERKNDSKWLIGVRSEDELRFLLDRVPRLVLIIGDYPHFEANDWNTVRFRAYEIWPRHPRHRNFSLLMRNYYRNIYEKHIATNPNKTPAPKNLWPYSFQFYMCNPVRVFHCVVRDALEDPRFSEFELTSPTADRSAMEPEAMPFDLLHDPEKAVLQEASEAGSPMTIQVTGLNEEQRQLLTLRDTDHAAPQRRPYSRDAR